MSEEKKVWPKVGPIRPVFESDEEARETFAKINAEVSEDLRCLRGARIKGEKDVAHLPLK
jgi:hypothetical protein